MSDTQTSFAKTILSQDKGLNEPMMEDCMRYGMTFGCTVNCPVLMRGECELMHDENAELYKACVETHSLDNEEDQEMKYAYYEPGDETAKPKTLPRKCECEILPGDWAMETVDPKDWGCFWRRRWPILQSSDVWAALSHMMHKTYGETEYAWVTDTGGWSLIVESVDGTDEPVDIVDGPCRVDPAYVGDGWEECSKDDAEEYQCKRCLSGEWIGFWTSICVCRHSTKYIYRFRRRVQPPFDQDIGEGWEECGKEDAEEYQCRSRICKEWGGMWSGIERCEHDKNCVYRFRRRVKPKLEHEARYPIEWSNQCGTYLVRLGETDYSPSAAQHRRDPDGREFAGFAFEGRDFLSSWSILPNGPDKPAQRATHAVYRFEVTG